MSRVKKHILSSLYKLYGNHQSLGYDISQTIVVTGCPRSGSTWLGEIFNALPGVVMLWEPMHLRHQPELEKLGFTWRPVVNEASVTPRQRQFFSDLLIGKSLNWHLASKVSFSDVITRKRWVLKFVRGNGLVEWLASEFPIPAPTVLLRHPCAVVSSQIKRRSLHGTESEAESLAELRNGVPNKMKEFLQVYPQYEYILEKINTWEELLAAIWAMDYYHVLSKDDPKWILITYEQLVANGVETVTNLFDHYGLDYSGVDIQTLMHKPSSTVVKGSQVAKQKNPLEGWREQLNEEQVGRILTVVQEFGITCYDNSLEPDYNFVKSKSILNI